MPVVTFYPTSIKAESFRLPSQAFTTSTAQATLGPVLEASQIEAWWETTKKKTVCMSSFPTQGPADPSIIGVGNGFVQTVMTAYNSHRMLVLRPDDVWMSILTQFSFFVNANAEKLRSSFVAHEGKMRLHVDLDSTGFDPEYLVAQIEELMHQNITDPSVREWIIPNFTTTTALDRTVSSIVMMSTFQKYFHFSCSETCGLPSVTLQGSKKDWQSLVRRIEKLKEYGPETTAWYHLLRPILRQFVAAFDNPSHPRNLDFWNKATHSRYYCGGGTLSGWITAFCVFNSQGKWWGGRLPDLPPESPVLPLVEEPILAAPAVAKQNFGRSLWSKITGKSKKGRQEEEEDPSGEELSNVFNATIYPPVDINNIPPTCVGAEVECIGTGPARKIQLLAGTGAFQVTSSGDKTHSRTGELDTLHPVMSWWIYVEDS